MDLFNAFLDFVVPPASLVMLAFAWPTLCFVNTCEWIYNTYFISSDMEDKVVIITGASSGIGEVIFFNLIFLYNFIGKLFPDLIF